MTDFAAIDFETANREPSSVCSVGVVVVRGGTVVEKDIPSYPPVAQLLQSVQHRCPWHPSVRHGIRAGISRCLG